MGLLNDSVVAGLGAFGIETEAKVKAPTTFGNNYDSFNIVEIVNGTQRDADAVVLAGRFMPHVPFEFGGTQKLVREDYPGSSEPSVQVLGARESNLTVKGHLKTNKLKDVSLRDAAVEYQQLIDAMRIRGNLVRLALVGKGESWHRYGFIEEVKFKIFTLQNIEYEISFLIVGFNMPKGWKVLVDGADDLIKPNKDITSRALVALQSAKNYPDSMPLSAADILNNGISKVAEAINLVTDFVTGITSDADQLMNSANRAIGLIKNARAVMSKTVRDMGRIKMSAESLASSADTEAKKTQALLKNVEHLHKVQRDFSTMGQMLAEMQKRFQKLASSVPKLRVLVKQGDTLQNLAMKHYQNSDLWKKIYDHNKLTSTNLVIGSVLEIPKE